LHPSSENGASCPGQIYIDELARLRQGKWVNGDMRDPYWFEDETLKMSELTKYRKTHAGEELSTSNLDNAPILGKLGFHNERNSTGEYCYMGYKNFRRCSLQHRGVEYITKYWQPSGAREGLSSPISDIARHFVGRPLLFVGGSTSEELMLGLACSLGRHYNKTKCPALTNPAAAGASGLLRSRCFLIDGKIGIIRSLKESKARNAAMISGVLQDAEIAIVNYGDHFNDNKANRKKLKQGLQRVISATEKWRTAGENRVAIFHDGPATHFGGKDGLWEGAKSRQNLSLGCYGEETFKEFQSKISISQNQFAKTYSKKECLCPMHDNPQLSFRHHDLNVVFKRSRMNGTLDCQAQSACRRHYLASMQHYTMGLSEMHPGLQHPLNIDCLHFCYTPRVFDPFWKELSLILDFDKQTCAR